MTTKVEIAELASRLREAANLGEPLAQSAVALVQLMCEDMKESLVAADGNDMLRLQGAVRHFQRLHKELTQKPPQTTRAE